MIGWQGGGDEIKTVELEEVNDNLEIVPMGRYRQHIKNVFCEGANDSLHIELTYLLTGHTFNNNIFTTGCYESSQNVGPKVGIGDYRNDWYVIRNGVRTDCSKVFTIYEDDTTFVEAFY